MPTDEQVNLIDHGLFVTHDYPCTARGCDRKAVLDMASGIYGPCGHCVAWMQERRLPWYRRLVQRRRKSLPRAKARELTP